MSKRGLNDFESDQYNCSAVKKPSGIQPLAVAAPKDSHVPLVVSLTETPGPVRLFNPYPPHQQLFSVTDECARRLLHGGQVRLLRSSKRIRGICPIIHKREPVKRVEIRGAAVGKPKRSGASWMQGTLPGWAWHEIFYAVLNSVREKRLEPWTWDEIVEATRLTKKKRRKGKVLSIRKRPQLFPPFQKAA